MCILCAICHLCVFWTYWPSILYLLFIFYVYGVSFIKCVSHVFSILFSFVVLGILCLRFSWCLLLDMSLVFGVIYVYVLAICFLWVQGPMFELWVFNILCVLSLKIMSSLCIVYFMWQKKFVCFSCFLICLCSSNVALLSLAWINPCSIKDIYPY
jgi:hypothetical protein